MLAKLVIFTKIKKKGMCFLQKIFICLFFFVPSDAVFLIDDS